MTGGRSSAPALSYETHYGPATPVFLQHGARSAGQEVGIVSECQSEFPAVEVQQSSVPEARDQSVAEAAQVLIGMKSMYRSSASDQVSGQGRPRDVTPVQYRQPRTQSIADPETPTRRFGSNGNREVTVVRDSEGRPDIHVSDHGGRWSWNSIEQSDTAVSELMRGSTSQVPEQNLPVNTELSEYLLELSEIANRSAESRMPDEQSVSSQSSVSIVSFAVESLHMKSLGLRHQHLQLLSCVMMEFSRLVALCAILHPCSAAPRSWDSQRSSARQQLSCLSVVAYVNGNSVSMETSFRHCTQLTDCVIRTSPILVMETTSSQTWVMTSTTAHAQWRSSPTFTGLTIVPALMSSARVVPSALVLTTSEPVHRWTTQCQQQQSVSSVNRLDLEQRVVSPFTATSRETSTVAALSTMATSRDNAMSQWRVNRVQPMERQGETGLSSSFTHRCCSSTTVGSRQFDV